jgi:WhiB family transcriptional regulator, redox-sensing transcriptional regulator
MSADTGWMDHGACRTADPELFFAEEPEDWRDLALCAEVDGELFFPEKGGSAREAKAVCMACEVRPECLEYVLEMESRPGGHGQWGIWGGLSARQRRPLVSARIAARKQEAA